jgi:multidrug resistance efflux pump
LLATIDDRNYRIALQRNATAVQQAQQSAASLNQPFTNKEIKSLDQQIRLQELAVEQTHSSATQRIQTASALVENAKISFDQLVKDLEDVISDDDVGLVDQTNQRQLTAAENTLNIVKQDTILLINDMMRNADVLLGLSDINRHLNDSYESELAAQNPSVLIDTKRKRHALNNTASSSLDTQ